MKNNKGTLSASIILENWGESGTKKILIAKVVHEIVSKRGSDSYSKNTANNDELTITKMENSEKEKYLESKSFKKRVKGLFENKVFRVRHREKEKSGYT